MSDIGKDAITRIYTDLMIDDCWAVQEERSFRWIGERLEQHVSASSPFTDDGFLLVRLVAECRVVEAVEASEEVVQACLAQANRHAFGSCYTYLAAERAICATASVFIHEQTSPWRVALFVRYVIGQLILAEAEADFLAAKCSGRVATRQHPTSGTRQQRDDMLNAIFNMLAPSGRTPSNSSMDLTSTPCSTSPGTLRMLLHSARAKQGSPSKRALAITLRFPSSRQTIIIGSSGPDSWCCSRFQIESLSMRVAG